MNGVRRDDGWGCQGRPSVRILERAGAAPGRLSRDSAGEAAKNTRQARPDLLMSLALPRIESGRMADMADYTHTIDRWDEATGERT